MSNTKKYIVVFDSEGFNAGIEIIESNEKSLKSIVKGLSKKVFQDLVASTDVELSDFHIESGISQDQANENFAKNILSETTIYVIDSDKCDFEDYDYDDLMDFISENDIKPYSRFTDI
ncbi:hypothetical protein CSR02_14045 [Acetobacter pomorum]|uniref:Uncharacterized protein n=1 Tax=Acetobacter pomorum TaxID=65959 RepID=A0A2G4RAX4_9PROT|nr:hypothetical protein [Acetobacter pomorum]PHY92925.1 hypothetical protein CSR02_14045 [Acetobacter pomorum]GBR53484.1 hypothetical protein AA11825_2478 [Acetobacter pomorum DSM 11825]